MLSHLLDEKQELAEAKKRLEVIRLAVKLGDEELLLKLGASEETIQSVRRLRAAEAENQKDYKSLPPKARAKVDLAVADLAGIEEFSDEITIKYLAGQLSIEEFDELERQINDITPATEE